MSNQILKFDITEKSDIYEDVSFVTKTLNDTDKKKGKSKKNIERVLDNRDKEIEERENRERQLAEIEKAKELQETKDAQSEIVDTWMPNY